jgi:membrane protein YdbS with pleckstrin-like domain
MFDQASVSFWWIAALAVVTLVCSIALTVVAFTPSPKGLTAVIVGIATTLFVAAPLEALSLVRSVMRHGLHRAEVAAREIRVRRDVTDKT